MPDQGETISAGGVEFHVEYRTFGGDRGPAIRVLAEEGGRRVQLLRFDCFENQPHYHYDPDGRDFHLRLSRETVPDPVAWALGELKQNLLVMVRLAGYPSVAERLDPAAVADALPRVAAAVQAQAAAAKG